MEQGPVDAQALSALVSLAELLQPKDRHCAPEQEVEALGQQTQQWDQQQAKDQGLESFYWQLLEDFGQA